MIKLAKEDIDRLSKAGYNLKMAFAKLNRAGRRASEAGKKFRESVALLKNVKVKGLK